MTKVPPVRSQATRPTPTPVMLTIGTFTMTVSPRLSPLPPLRIDTWAFQFSWAIGHAFGSAVVPEVHSRLNTSAGCTDGNREASTSPSAISRTSSSEMTVSRLSYSSASSRKSKSLRSVPT